jgi:hypothetical protein
MIFVVEYDCRGERAAKEFADQYKAAAFYRSKHKGGKNPKITTRKPEELVVSDIYHTAISSKKRDIVAEPLLRWTDGRGVAFVHDISSGVIPDEYRQADVLYSEPAWRHGYEKFSECLEVKPVGGYDAYLATQLKFIRDTGIPAFLVIGTSMIEQCDPKHAHPVKLRGGDAVLAVWNTTLAVTVHECDRFIDHLAASYECVVDPSCGYGNVARWFHKQGKMFVATDINPVCIGVIARRLGDEARSVST